MERKKLYLIVIAAVLLVSAVSIIYLSTTAPANQENEQQEPEQTGFSGGDGSKESPYQIETAAQLDRVRNYLNNSFVLTTDINLDGYENWEPIGAFEPLSDAPEDEETPKPELAFTGTFDGDGHTISNLTINQPEGTAVGLFGCAVGTEENPSYIYDLTVENVDVTGYLMVGGVVGLQAEDCIVENVNLTGNNSVRGFMMIGGITCGGLHDMINCHATADIIVLGDGGAAAGVLGGGLEGSLIDCTATGTVTAEGDNCFALGGLAGCAGYAQTGEVTNSHAEGVTITALGENNTMIGGLLGYTGTYDWIPGWEDTPTPITECSADATITVSDSTIHIGGLVGGSFYHVDYAEVIPIPSRYAISDCSTSGSITGGSEAVGSIVGYAYNSTVENCTSTMTWAAGVLEQIGYAEKELSTVFADGIGTESYPYQIATAEQLNQVHNYLGNHFVLTGNIDLSEYTNCTPIGAYEPTDVTAGNYKANPALAFTGSFNGAGYTISNLAITRESLSGEDMSGSGLFGCIAGNGSIQNLKIENAHVSSTGTCIGALVGMAMSSNENAIKGITLSGNNSISGAGSVAGLVGSAQDTNIIDCHASADVTMTAVGNGAGIMGGGIEGGTISGCSATGTVTATETMTYNGVTTGSIGIGGLAGCAFDTPEVINCTAENVIISVGGNANMVGGLLGYAGVVNEGLFASDPAGFTLIKDCEANNVSITAGPGASRIGGIVGSGFSGSNYNSYYPASSAIHIVGCKASGTITVDDGVIVGSILGYAFRNCAVVSCDGDNMIGATNQVGAADAAQVVLLGDV